MPRSSTFWKNDPSRFAPTVDARDAVRAGSRGGPPVPQATAGIAPSHGSPSGGGHVADTPGRNTHVPDRTGGGSRTLRRNRGIFGLAAPAWLGAQKLDSAARPLHAPFAAWSTSSLHLKARSANSGLSPIWAPLPSARPGLTATFRPPAQASSHGAFGGSRSPGAWTRRPVIPALSVPSETGGDTLYRTDCSALGYR